MAYTGSDVDHIANEIEESCQKVRSLQSSSVKLKVAETHLVEVAEKARDLFQIAVKGDHGTMRKVFEGQLHAGGGGAPGLAATELTVTLARAPRHSVTHGSGENLQEKISHEISFGVAASAVLLPCRKRE